MHIQTVKIVLICVVATVTSAAPVFLGSHQFFPTVPYVSPAYSLEIPYQSSQPGFYAAPPVHTGVFSDGSRGGFVFLANQQRYEDYPIARSFLPSAPFGHNRFGGYPVGPIDHFNSIEPASFRSNGPTDGFHSSVHPPAGLGGFQLNHPNGGPQNQEQAFGVLPSARQSAGSFSPPAGRGGSPAGYEGPVTGGAPHGLGGPGQSPGSRGPHSGPVGFQSPNGNGPRNGGFGSGDYGPPSRPQGAPGTRQSPGPQHQGFPAQREHRSDSRPLPGPGNH